MKFVSTKKCCQYIYIYIYIRKCFSFFVQREKSEYFKNPQKSTKRFLSFKKLFS